MTHGMYKTSEYFAWSAMIQRCTNPKDCGYKNYGGRGIKICDRWRSSFIDFYKDMGEKPFKEAQLDRVDNDGNYELNNCEWVSRTKNMRHTRRVKLSIEKAAAIRKLNNETKMTYRQIGNIFKVNKEAIYKVVSNQRWVNDE